MQGVAKSDQITFESDNGIYRLWPKVIKKVMKSANDIYRLWQKVIKKRWQVLIVYADCGRKGSKCDEKC